MGNSEAETPSNCEKVCSPTQEHANIHAYPNWAAIQAYYGPGVTIPPPYFNSAITSGHPPHPYMWGTPQPLVPPYGTPYAAIYSHGGVYAHPLVPPGSHSQGHGNSSPTAVSEAMVATPLSLATPAKSSNNKGRGLMKKLKGFGGLTVSIGNENSGSAEVSQRLDCGTEGSSNASDGNTAVGGDQKQRKRRCKGVATTVKDEKLDTEAHPIYGGEAYVVTMASASVVGNPVGTVPSPDGKAKTIAATFPPTQGSDLPAHDSLPSELRIKDERELKRERRKQANRESARRSRLRKQAETEELVVKVESLSAENLSLKSEISKLTKNSEKLRLKNAALMEKLKISQSELLASNDMEAEGVPTLSTENFLSRVNNNSVSVTKSMQRESATHENSNSGSKLHQLLESSTKANAVVAG